MAMLPPCPIRRHERELRPAGTLPRLRELLVLLAIVCTLTAAGCAKTRAEAVVVGSSPLAVPAPPPRVLVPVELEAISATAGAPPAAAPDVTSGTPPSEPANNAAAARPAPPRAERAPSQPPAEANGVETPRDVRVIPPADNAALEERFSTLVASANRDLARVDYARLSSNAREHYDQARRHLEMANNEFKERNLQYALSLAQTGATVASQLVAASR